VGLSVTHEDDERLEMVFHPDLMEAQIEAVEAGVRLFGDADQAPGLAASAAARLQGYSGPFLPHVIDLLISVAELSLALGDDGAAKALFERAVSAQEDRYGRKDPRLIRALTNLGQLQSRIGDFKGAESKLRRTIELYDRHVPPEADTPKALQALATVLQHQGKFDESARISEHVVELSDFIEGQMSRTAIEAGDDWARTGPMPASLRCGQKCPDLRASHATVGASRGGVGMVGTKH